MIRCENCGHTLNSNQRICDVCGKPVAKKKAEDIELEEQLAQSIAKIVENETEDAQVYVKQMQGNLDKKNAESKNKTDVLGVSQRSSDRQRTQPVQKSASTKKPVKKKKNNGGKIAAIVCVVIVCVAALIGLAFFTINSVLKKAQIILLITIIQVLLIFRMEKTLRQYLTLKRHSHFLKQPARLT